MTTAFGDFGRFEFVADPIAEAAARAAPGAGQQQAGSGFRVPAANKGKVCARV